MFAFTVLQTSDWNKKLRDQLDTFQNLGLSGNSETFTPMQLSLADKMGKDLITGINGWISMHPTYVRGTGVASVTWVIKVERINFVEGDDENVGV